MNKSVTWGKKDVPRQKYIQMAREKCPRCNSTKIIKKGKNKKKLLQCKNYNKWFLTKKKIGYVKIYEDYTKHKFTYQELEVRYGISRKTIRKYFDCLNLKDPIKHFKEKEEINLILTVVILEENLLFYCSIQPKE